MIKTKKAIYHVASFLIPVAIMLIVYKYINLWPFGDKSIIPFWDMREQYSSYFEYLKTILTGSNDFVYTFSKVLGGDIIGLMGYYLSSPFNILFVILNDVKIDIVILIITLLKLGICGLTFYIFANSKSNRQIMNLIFSSSYALMAYNIVYQQNIMWIDGVIWLPIIALGIEKILDNGNCATYVLSLAVAIISNYYIGYMLGLFSILYFFYLKIYKKQFTKKTWFKSICKFLGYTAISVGMTAFFLFPILMSLKGGKGPRPIGTEGFYKFVFAITPLDVLSKVYTGAFEWHEVMDGFPLIFCGWIAFISMLLYFMNRKISLRERITSGVFLFVLFCGITVNAFITIWHGFSLPTGFPARDAFIITFFILSLGVKGFAKIQDGGKVYHFIIIFVLISIMTFSVKSAGYSYIDQNTILFTCISVSLGLVALYLIAKFGKLRILKIAMNCILFAICIMDLGVNGYITLSKYPFENINSFNDFKVKYKPICDYANEIGEGFYRVEKDFARTRNDSMLFNLRGLSHYSSSEKLYIKDFMGKLGFDRFGYVYATYGKGNTVLMDSIFNVKYFLSNKQPNHLYKSLKTFDNAYVFENPRDLLVDSDYSGKIKEENMGTDNLYVFENPYALPVGFISSDKIKKVNMETDNRFELQNNILSAIVNEKVEVLKPCENIECSKENLEVTCKNKVKYFLKEDRSQPASIEYNVLEKNGNPVYLDFITPSTSSADVFINGKIADFDFSSMDKAIVRLGTFNPDEDLKVKIELTNKRLCLSKTLIYYEDLDKLKECYDKICRQECKFERVTSSRLKGHVSVKQNNSCLLFTIPFEEDWNIYIDGTRASQTQVIDALMSVNVPVGEHDIELVYVPRSFFPGLYTSIVSFLIFLFFQCRKRLLKQKIESQN